MANPRLIEEYIRDSGYKLRHVARALHISESALHSFLSFIDQFEVESLYLQNPPAHIVSQNRRISSAKSPYRLRNAAS